MTNEIHQPTPAEIRAFEAKARTLRAEAMRDGSKVITSFVANLLHRVADAFSRPAHA